MNVIDSSAWIAYFTGDSNAAVFAKPIESHKKLIVPSITIVETYKYILRYVDKDAALQAVGHMKQGQVVDLDMSLVIDAAHFGSEHKLPLADSIIYATAQKYGAVLWTQDKDFEGLANVRFISK